MQKLLVLNLEELCIDNGTASQRRHEELTYKYLNTYKASKPIGAQGNSEYAENLCPIKKVLDPLVLNQWLIKNMD